MSIFAQKDISERMVFLFCSSACFKGISKVIGSCFVGKWRVRTILTVQVRNTKDVELAAHGCGESAANRTLAGDELANSSRARADGGSRSKAHKTGDGEECELHVDCNEG